MHRMCTNNHKKVCLQAPQEVHHTDGAGSKPAYSLRMLCSAPDYQRTRMCTNKRDELHLQTPQEARLTDGAGSKPAYNLRTLCRALDYARTTAPHYGLQRALYDGFSMAFATQVGAGMRCDLLILCGCCMRLSDSLPGILWAIRFCAYSFA